MWTIVCVVGKYFNIARHYIYSRCAHIHAEHIPADPPGIASACNNFNNIYINKISVKLPYFIKRKSFLTILILEENSTVYNLDCEKTVFFNLSKGHGIEKTLAFDSLHEYKYVHS